MIEFFNKKKHYSDLIEFISENFDGDFYLLKNNRRIFINNIYSLKYFISVCSNILVNKDEGRIDGVLGIYPIDGVKGRRRYLKINSLNENLTQKLLSVLFWNSNCSYFVQINNKSKHCDLLLEKGFKFFDSRGNEILLRRSKWQLPYQRLNRQ